MKNKFYPDRTDYLIDFIYGFVFGLFCCFLLFLFGWSIDLGSSDLAIIIGVATFFGLVSIKLGDEFWLNITSLFNKYDI